MELDLSAEENWPNSSSPLVRKLF